MDEHKDLEAVLTFWFTELTPKDWFSGGKEVDERIAARFSELHPKVAAGEFWRERAEPKLALAEVIVLDQFSRNLFRGTARAFAYDGQALVIAQSVVARGDYIHLFSPAEQQFLYLPFMHSESRMIHKEALNLFQALGNPKALSYEAVHKDIIDRFGRYPHRNLILERDSTPEEIDYLAHTKEDFF